MEPTKTEKEETKNTQTQRYHTTNLVLFAVPHFRSNMKQFSGKF